MTRMFVSVSLAVLASLACAGAALAQSATGTLIPGRESSAMVDGALSPKGLVQPVDQGMESGRTMARCMAGNHLKDTEALLGAPDMAAFNAAYRRAKNVISNCLTMIEVYGDTARINMRFDYSTMRSLLAEARFRKLGVPPLAATSYDPRATGSEWIAQDAASRATLQTADCLASRQPGAVAGVLATPPARPAESVAFSALMPHIGGCLDRNVRLSVKKVGLRLALASAYDRRVRQPASVSGTH